MSNEDVFLYPEFHKLQRYRKDEWGAVMQDGKHSMEVRERSPEKALGKLREYIHERRRESEAANTRPPATAAGAA